MGILLAMTFLGSAFLMGLGGMLSLLLYGVLTRHRRRSWGRFAAIALLLSGLFALAAVMASSLARGGGLAMADSTEQMLQAVLALSASGSSGLTGVAAAVIALLERRNRSAMTRR